MFAYDTCLCHHWDEKSIYIKTLNEHKSIFNFRLTVTVIVIGFSKWRKRLKNEFYSLMMAIEMRIYNKKFVVR